MSAPITRKTKAPAPMMCYSVRNVPCMNCEKRSAECHPICEDYKAYKDEIKAFREKKGPFIDNYNDQTAKRTRRKLLDIKRGSRKY